MATLEAPAGRADRVPGPELQALYSARLWSVLILAIVGLALGAYSIVLVWAELPALQRIVAVLAILAGAIAVIFRKSSWALATIAFSGLLLMLANILPSADIPWLHINGAALFVAFVTAMLVAPRYALVCAIVLPVLVHVAWSAAPDAVIATGYAAWDGWIPPIQVAVMLLLVNVVWWRLHAYAVKMDEEYEHDVLRLQAGLAESERQAALRRTAIALHESLLNGIRGALATGRVESSRLTTLSRSASVTVNSASDVQNASMMGGAVADTVGMPIAISYEGPDVAHVDAATFEAVRAAVVELIRNEIRYGDSVAPEVRTVCRDGCLVVTCPGQIAPADPLASGLGVRRAVIDALSAVGATIEQADGVVTISVDRLPATASRPRRDSVFSRSRGLMSAFLGAMVLSGILYFAAMITSGAGSVPVYIATALALAAGLILVTLTLRSGPLPAPLALGLALLPAAIPWLFAVSNSAICAAAPEISASAVNVSGFAVIGISLWSRWWVMAPTLAMWVGGMFVLIAQSNGECAALLVQPVLNSLFVMPLFVAGTLLAARAYARASSARETVELAQMRESISAQAQAEMNSRLEDLVDDVVRELQSIASGHPVDRDVARRLRLSEGRIRAAVQVDPVLSGAFDAFAAKVVESLAVKGITVDVKLLESSADPRPLPPELCEILTRAASGGHASIAAFQDGEVDYLTVSAPASDVSWSIDVSDACVDGVDLLVDEAHSEIDPSGARIFMLRRRLGADVTHESALLAPA